MALFSKNKPAPTSGYTRQVTTLKAVNRGLMLTIMMMALAILALIAVLNNTTKTQTVWIPPETSEGALVNTGEPNKANVYGFANYIMQYLYHWSNDGADDYKKHIFDITYYITPNFKAELDDDYAKITNRGGINEIDGRQRMLLPLDSHQFSSTNVTKIAKGVWNVELVYSLRENYKRQTIKDVEMKYSLRVVQSKVDIETNKWGLKIDRFNQQPERLVQN